MQSSRAAWASRQVGLLALLSSGVLLSACAPAPQMVYLMPGYGHGMPAGQGWPVRNIRHAIAAPDEVVADDEVIWTPPPVAGLPQTPVSQPQPAAPAPAPVNSPPAPSPEPPKPAPVVQAGTPECGYWRFGGWLWPCVRRN